MRNQLEEPNLGASLSALGLNFGILVFPSVLSAQQPVNKAGEVTEQPRIGDANQARKAILRSCTSALQDAIRPNQVPKGSNPLYPLPVDPSWGARL